MKNIFDENDIMFVRTNDGYVYLFAYTDETYYGKATKTNYKIMLDLLNNCVTKNIGIICDDKDIAEIRLANDEEKYVFLKFLLKEFNYSLYEIFIRNF